jgi:Tol biopolymer transport system component
MVSRNASNVAGNAASTNADMSADGTYIVFESAANNLTLPAPSSYTHIYYVDTSATTHAVELVSLTTTDTAPTANSNKPSVSDDGSMVVFHTAAALDATLDSNNVADVYLRDRTAPLTKLISVNLTADNGGNGVSNNARISGNADYVAFESLASNLVTGDTLGVKDIFVRDLSTSPAIIIDRVNVPTSIAEANASSSQPAISSDGRYLSFQSTFKFTIDDTNTLSDIFRAHNSTHP